MAWKLRLAVVLMFAAPVAEADLRINEVMASNGSAALDETGASPDWIEVHNTGDRTVDLVGYGISDDPSDPFKWKFDASLPLGPGEFLLVWASGNDRQPGEPIPGGLLREVYRGIPGADVDALLEAPGFPENPDETTVLGDVLEVPADQGDDYGQRITGLLVVPESGSYRFWISADDRARLLLGEDGRPETQAVLAEVPGWTNPREWDRHSQQESEDIFLDAGKTYRMKVLMKESGGGDHLGVMMQRPDGTLEEPVLAKHFSYGRSEPHKNFAISAGGEAIRLTAPDGSQVDLAPPAALPRDVSYGRSPADPDVWHYFDRPTPGAANATAGYAEIVSARPIFSASGGFFTEPFDLELLALDPELDVLFTLDGSVPDPANLGGATFGYKDRYPTRNGDPVGELLTGVRESRIHDRPIPIGVRTGEPGGLSARNSTYNNDATSFAPTAEVFRGSVVRAGLFKQGALPGPVVTHTYFVDPAGGGRYQLPVLSLTMDEEALFGYHDGIYNAGRDFDDWRSTTGARPNGHTPANYHRRGDHAEFPVHLELFEPGEGRALAQDAGFRIHGGWSRYYPQKSLRIYAASRYGEEEIDYPLIGNLRGAGTGAPVETFRRILLRNSGNDNQSTRIRDAVIQRVAGPLGLDHQGYRPAVHFINGEYWGLINIRERIDRFFVASHHGVDPEEVAILSNDAEVREGDAGDRQDFLRLRSHIATRSMADPDAFAEAERQMDMENFILYNVANIYANNGDWPHNNVDFWRANGSAASAAGDGRWRWILFDTDFGFGLNGDHNSNTLRHATDPGSGWSTVVLRRLLENPAFRTTFINAFADHIATTFRPERIEAIADEMAAEIAPSMAEHARRWRNQGSSSVDGIKSFGRNRPAAMRQHLTEFFGLSGSVPVTLDVAGTGGRLTINTVDLDGETPGIADPSRPFPWTADYFAGVPVTVTAVPGAGNRFAGWLEHPDHPAETITLDPADGIHLTAVFEEIPPDELAREIHVWSFENHAIGPPSSEAAGAWLDVEPGPATGVVLNPAAQDFETTHLRINNPLDSALLLALPATGFTDLRLDYLTRRSGQGAGVHRVSYTVDGSNWIQLATYDVADAAPQLRSFDFGEVTGSADNPDFAVRIEFEQGAGGTAGNNRFDDITLRGRPLAGDNRPPVLVTEALPEGNLVGQVRRTLVVAGLESWFEDADGDSLTFSADVERSDVLSAGIGEGSLHLTGLAPGESEVTIEAHDGTNLPVAARLRVLVHPAPHVLADGSYRFDSWNPASPAMTYPEHMIFLQGEGDDSTLTTTLDRAYRIPAWDAADPADEDFPYAATSRTRVNGLADDGVSFINTGRGRDLGGALLALDTRDVTEGALSFTAGTVTPNFRVYGLRLQYRLGQEGPFADLTDATGAPVEYVRAASAGDFRRFGPIPLPAETLGREDLQLLWRYHHLDGTSGARAELRLDDVHIHVVSGSYAEWRAREFPDPADQSDPDVSGPHADPLGSGVSNLMRYALGIGASDHPDDMMPQVVADPAGPPRFRFPFDPGKSDITGIAEVSADLSTWSELPIDSSNSPRVGADGWLEVVDEAAPDNAARRFYRLRIRLEVPP